MLFHEKHNYFVRITPVDGLVEISFPKNIFLDKPEINVLIGMTPFALTAFFDDGFKEIVCPSHIMRPLLFKEIIYEMVRRKMHISLFQYINLVKYLPSPENIKRECRLIEELPLYIANQECSSDLLEDLTIIEGETIFND